MLTSKKLLSSCIRNNCEIAIDHSAKLYGLTFSFDFLLTISIAKVFGLLNFSYMTTTYYDVFPSFSGEDVRITFLSHFLKELDQKSIIAFKENEIERNRSLNPELKQAIKDSRIAVVIFSKNYASSSRCLNELLEIVKSKEECGQIVIPIFYGLDPSHVKEQTGDFGKNFEETCYNKAEELIIQWREALTNVACILGYHSVEWDNEATMIEAIAIDVLNQRASRSGVEPKSPKAL